MKSYKNKIKKLRNKCDEFLQQVNSIGNECAWTDRKLEDILEFASKIKKDYEHEIPNTNPWEGYLDYLKEWASDHKDILFEGMCPVCFDEWLDNEAEEFGY